jgi:hypothetical protein
MEEMSKKTKKLEKENHNLTRKHELTSSNILKMAEERNPIIKEMEALRKKNEKLETLCRGMQMQGRGRPEMIGVNGAQVSAPIRQQGLQSESVHSESEERTESDYSYEDEDEEEEDDDEDDEEEDSEDLDDESELESPVMQHAVHVQAATNGQQTPNPQHPGNQNQTRPEYIGPDGDYRPVPPPIPMSPRSEAQYLMQQYQQYQQYQQAQQIVNQQPQSDVSKPNQHNHNNKDRNAMPPPPPPTTKVAAVKEIVRQPQPVVNGLNGRH